MFRRKSHKSYLPTSCLVASIFISNLACGGANVDVEVTPVHEQKDALCRVTLRYPQGEDVFVGQAAEIAPELDCLPNHLPRQFRISRQSNGFVVDDNGVLRADPVRADGRNAGREIFVPVKLCYGHPESLQNLIKKLSAQFPAEKVLKEFNAAKIRYTLDGSLITVKKDDFLILAPTPFNVEKPVIDDKFVSDKAEESGKVPLLAQMADIVLIDFLPFVRISKSFVDDKNDGEVVELEPAPMLADCEGPMPGMSAQDAAAMREQCRQEVQEHMAACAGEEDVEACVRQRATRSSEESNGCTLGQKTVEQTAIFDLFDKNALRLMNQPDNSLWQVDADEERRIRITGGNRPLVVEQIGEFPGGVDIDIDVDEWHARIIVSGNLDEDAAPTRVGLNIIDPLGRTLQTSFLVASEPVFIACSEANLQGECDTIDAIGNGQSGRVLRFHGDYASFDVKDGYQVIACDDVEFDGACGRYRAGGAPAAGFPHIGDWRSLQIQPNPTSWNGYEHLGTWPQQRETPWSEEAQGIASDDTHWYVSNHKRVYKYPHGSNLDGPGELELHSGDFYLGMKDFKDLAISRFDGKLYVPGKAHGHAAMARIDPVRLQIEAIGYIRTCAHPPSFVAPHPTDGDLFIACGSGALNTLDVYDPDFSDGDVLTHLYDVELNIPDRPGGMRWIQAGEFSASGKLYFGAENIFPNGGDGPAGVWILRFEGRQTIVENVGNNGRYVEFGYGGATHWGTGHRHNEMEGLTIWDGGDEEGQIHVVKLENELGQDDVGVRHYRLNDPSGL